MKQTLLCIYFIIVSFYTIAQTKPDEHLLDGTSLDINYKFRSHVHVEFNEGQIISTWISGSGQNETTKESYRSIKTGDKTYIFSYLKTPSHSFVTSIINFNQNVMYISAIRGVGTGDEAIFLEEATIEHLNLKEKVL